MMMMMMMGCHMTLDMIAVYHLPIYLTYGMVM